MNTGPPVVRYDYVVQIALILVVLSLLLGLIIMLRMGQQAKIKELQAQIEQYEKRIEELQALITEYERQIEELKRAANAMNTEIETLTTQVATLQPENAELRATVERLKPEVSEMTSEIERLQQENELLAAQLEDLKAENMALKAELAAAQDTTTAGKPATAKTREELELSLVEQAATTLIPAAALGIVIVAVFLGIRLLRSGTPNRSSAGPAGQPQPVRRPPDQFIPANLIEQRDPSAHSRHNGQEMPEEEEARVF